MFYIVLCWIEISTHLHLFVNSVSFAMEEIGSIFQCPQGNLHLGLLKSLSCTNEDKIEKIAVQREMQNNEKQKAKWELLKTGAVIRYQLWILYENVSIMNVHESWEFVLSQILMLSCSHLSIPSTWKLHGNLSLENDGKMRWCIWYNIKVCLIELSSVVWVKGTFWVLIKIALCNCKSLSERRKTIVSEIISLNWERNSNIGEWSNLSYFLVL